MMADQENRSNWTQPDAHHWSVGAWEKFLVEDGAPSLMRWQLGTELPEVRLSNHLATGSKRRLQEAIYAIGLPRVLDMTRASWTVDAHPLPIAPETQGVLARELGR
jgi:hypothetical protein